MTQRHEFLAQLHTALQPQIYLEIGVQYGGSLRLAGAAKQAIGIDPYPQLEPSGNQQIFRCTSDEYFMYYSEPDLMVDFAFIDGSHLFEDALRDFIQLEAHALAHTIVVFDDMLPYTQEMTNRIMIPGHWTGDVWKIQPIFAEYRPNLHFLMVDTEPTGTMVVWGLDHRAGRNLAMGYPEIVTRYLEVADVPQTVLGRDNAVTADEACAQVQNYLAPQTSESRP